MVEVCEVGKETKKSVPVDNLLLDEELIAVVPPTLFVVHGGEVIFDFR